MIQSTSNMGEKGDGIFEMLLFMPLALLILFVGVDVGLSRLDYALVVDAVREGIHKQDGIDSKIYRLDHGFVAIDKFIVASTATKIADRIAKSVSDKRVSLGSKDGKDQIKVKVIPLVLDVDSNSGEVVGYQREQEVVSGFGNPSLNYKGSSGNETIEIENQFIYSQIKESDSRSGFAILRPSFSALDYQNNDSYLASQVAFMVSVDVISPSINPIWLNATLGSDLGYKIMELQIIRN